MMLSGEDDTHNDTGEHRGPAAQELDAGSTSVTV